MPKRLPNYFVDQFGEPLEVGGFYGVHLTGPQTKALVYQVVEIIRDRLTLAEVDVSKPKIAGVPVFSMNVLKFTNLMASSYAFVRLNAEYREVTQLAEPAKAKRARNLREGLAQVAKEAKVLRARQRRLIQEVASALEGAADPTEVGDMAATFIRDDESHVKIRDFVALYLASLQRNERGAE